MVSVPAPTRVIVTSNKPNPIWPIGSAVTLTCSVEVNLMVDIPVIATLSLRGPSGEIHNSTAPVPLGSTYARSDALISSFVDNHSGLYSCSAAISSNSSFIIKSVNTTSEVKRVTIG